MTSPRTDTGNRRRWPLFLALAALAAVFPVAGAQALDRPSSAANAEHSDSTEHVPASTDADEIIRGVAPEWPFQGFFAPALGRFWDTGRGRVHDVSDGIEFGACYEIYVDVDAESIRMGYASYMAPDKHYVIPWGDTAYPVIHSSITSRLSSNAAAPRTDFRHANIRNTTERIQFTTQNHSWYSDETENTYSHIVIFQAHNSIETKSYLPITPRRLPVDGFVEVESEGLPVDDLDAMDGLAREFGGRAYIQKLEVRGSDGRFYGFSLYNVAHPVCSDVDLSFVVDGTTGQVVACYEYSMEAQTSLVFVAPEDSFVSDDFALPNAIWPVEADGCGVRLDGEHPEEFFRRVASLGSSDLDEQGNAER